MTVQEEVEAIKRVQVWLDSQVDPDFVRFKEHYSRIIDELVRTSKLLKDIADAHDQAEKYVGCGDNSCRFITPSGMATNGGCRCIERGTARPGVIGALARLFKLTEGCRP